MAENKGVTLLTPVGRFVGGNLYEPRTKDGEGRPLVTKSGPEAGKPRVSYELGLAIKKGAEQHWSQTQWGALIYNEGVRGFPAGQHASPMFAWKITDGDSNVPNSKGRKPSDNPNYRGHWILWFSSSYAPKIVDAKGTSEITEPNAVKTGYFIQVYGTVAENGSTQKPGVYLNPQIVALSAYGPEIVNGPDASTVGFGADVALPAGASAVPVGAFAAPIAAPPTVPTPAPAAPLPVVSVAAPIVPPHLPILGVGAPLAAPAVPPPAPVPIAPPPAPARVRVMTPKAGGATYEQFIAQGWTDELLVSNGMMQA